MYLFFIKDDLKLAIQRAMNDEGMQKSIKKMHDLFTGKYFLYCLDQINRFFKNLGTHSLYFYQGFQYLR